MGVEPKPKAARKAKRRRQKREEYVDYIVEIDGWDWGYSFSLNMERQPVDPYHEFAICRSRDGCCSRRDGSPPKL